MTVFFNDQQEIVCAQTERRVSRPSAFLERFRETSAKQSAAREWKTKGQGARFRGDYEESNLPINAHVNQVTAINDHKVYYTFSVNDISGIYQKDFSLEKEDETHVVHSAECVFYGGTYDKNTDTFAFSVQDDGVTAHIARLVGDNGDYQVLTAGDALDENPSFDPTTGDILFDSAGVGRREDGSVFGYSESSVFALSSYGDVTELARKDGVNLYRPQKDAHGNLYYLSRPQKEKRSGLFVDIITIPFKIVVAIYRFLETFVTMFTGKSFTEKSANPAKGKEYNSAQIYVNGNLYLAEQSKKKKDDDEGIVPKSHKLVRVTANGEEVVYSGVCDYCLVGDDVYLSNGRRVIRLSDGKKEVLDKATLITTLSVTE